MDYRKKMVSVITLSIIEGGYIVIKVDVNCDLGESFGRYELGEYEDVLQYVTSANIACGFHAGDPTVMRKTVAKAVEHNVRIGAHPSLPDLIGFGRREMKVTPQEVYDMVVYQIGALDAFLRVHNTQLQHVKPHGALYNMAAVDPLLAEAIAKAVHDVSPSLVLYGLSGSELTKAGERIGLTVAHEVFADRTYQRNGTLTPRSEAHALITDEQQALEQIRKMVLKGQVKAVDGSIVDLKADTICVHGDTPHAVAFARLIYDDLRQREVNVQSFIP